MVLKVLACSYQFLPSFPTLTQIVLFEEPRKGLEHLSCTAKLNCQHCRWVVHATVRVGGNTMHVVGGAKLPVLWEAGGTACKMHAAGREGETRLCMWQGVC